MSAKFKVGDLVHHEGWRPLLRVERVMPPNTYSDDSPRQQYYLSRLTHLRPGYDEPGVAKDLMNEPELTLAEPAEVGMLF